MLLPLEESNDTPFGLVVTLQDACFCGARCGVIRRGPHVAELRCEGCGRHRSWMSRQSFNETKSGSAVRAA